MSGPHVRGRQKQEQGTHLSVDRASIMALTVIWDFFIAAEVAKGDQDQNDRKTTDRQRNDNRRHRQYHSYYEFHVYRPETQFTAVANHVCSAYFHVYSQTLREYEPAGNQCDTDCHVCRRNGCGRTCIYHTWYLDASSGC